MKKPRLRGVRILHEDLDVLVVEKAAGILSQALRHSEVPSVEGELTDYLRKGQWKSTKRAYLVHRLDRETSGVMMVAKNERAQTWLRDHWNEVTEKVYLARVEGALPAGAGVFESYLREDENYFVKSVKNPQYGKLARTEWKSFQSPDGAPAQGPEETTLVEVALKSGRKNQIRVHFSENGHPVVGDAKYGHGQRGDVLCLHAWKLKFRHPHTNETMSFETGLPAFVTGAPTAGAPATGAPARRMDARAPVAGAQSKRRSGLDGEAVGDESLESEAHLDRAAVEGLRRQDGRARNELGEVAADALHAAAAVRLVDAERLRLQRREVLGDEGADRRTHRAPPVRRAEEDDVVGREVESVDLLDRA